MHRNGADNINETAVIPLRNQFCCVAKKMHKLIQSSYSIELVSYVVCFDLVSLMLQLWI